MMGVRAGEPKQGKQYVSEVTDDTAARSVPMGWRVFVRSHDIRDRSTFFDAVRDTLPLDPPPHGDRSWDALADSLSGGLYLLADNLVVIIRAERRVEGRVRSLRETPCAPWRA